MRRIARLRFHKMKGGYKARPYGLVNALLA